MVPHLAECVRRAPAGMVFVLDHLGYNAPVPPPDSETTDSPDRAGENQADSFSWYEAWAAGLSELAQQPNVYAKLGGIEEWRFGEDEARAEKLLEHAIRCFGFDRVLFESNWFVGEVCGREYGRNVETVRRVVEKCGGSADDLDKVFFRNAVKVYRLEGVGKLGEVVLSQGC